MSEEFYPVQSVAAGANPNEERLRWIKRFRQRKGLKAEVKGVPYELFGVADWEALIDLIDHVQWMIPPSKSSQALFAALGRSASAWAFFAPEDLWSQDSVIDRRKMLAAHWGVSVSTLERLEAEGAILLDYYIGVLESPSFVSAQFDAVRSGLHLTRWWAERRGVVIDPDVWESALWGPLSEIEQKIRTA